MNKTIKIIIWVVVLAVIIWGAVALTGKKNATPTEKQTIKIGVVMPLTGIRADAGEFTKNALDIARTEINSNQNLKYRIDLAMEDSKYEPPVAVSALRKLLDYDKIHYVIGPYGSSEVAAAAPIAEQAGVVMIIPGAQSEEISQMGDYIFRVIHNSAQEAPIFAKFVAGKLKSDTLHFLAINTAITDPYLKSFRPVFEAEGKKIGLIEKFDQKTTDFRTELTKIKVKNPTDIFLLASPKMVGLILKQANDLGVKSQFYNIGVEGPDLVSVGGRFAEGLLYPYSYDAQGSEPRVKAFYEAYTNKFGVEPDTIAANSYDAAYLLSGCFEQYGDNAMAVKNCLYNVKDFNGASGAFSIDQNGDAIKNIFVKTVKDGKFVRYQQ